jgi:hypothetical protein
VPYVGGPLAARSRASQSMGRRRFSRMRCFSLCTPDGLAVVTSLEHEPEAHTFTAQQLILVAQDVDELAHGVSADEHPEHGRAA